MKKVMSSVAAVILATVSGTAAAGGVVVYDAYGNIERGAQQFKDGEGNKVGSQQIDGRYYLTKTVSTDKISYTAPRTQYYVATNPEGKQQRLLSGNWNKRNEMFACQKPTADEYRNTAVPSVVQISKTVGPRMIDFTPNFSMKYDKATDEDEKPVIGLVGGRTVWYQSLEGNRYAGEAAFDFTCLYSIRFYKDGDTKGYSDIAPVTVDVWTRVPLLP